ncbi:MAG: hypothetical protein HXX11_11720 [Desulfuromonadales bacterium]|nr:hypothetical protein [Desulfuromonadales bacterium]
MRMRIVSIVSLVFIGISVIFLAVSLRDYLENRSRMTIARKVWLRMALIFALVGTGLYVLQGYLH